MVVIVLVVPSSQNGPDRDFNNNETASSHKSQTPKSNHKHYIKNKEKKAVSSAALNHYQLYYNVNPHHQQQSNSNSSRYVSPASALPLKVDADAQENLLIYNNANKSTNFNNNKNYQESDACKNYVRHITRVTISDEFLQAEIGSDQAEAVTKEGKLLVFFWIWKNIVLVVVFIVYF